MNLSVPLQGIAVLAGLALGSFAVTAGLRMSAGGSALWGRSCCDGCGRRLRFAETTPVVSFVAARGACGTCNARIDPTHLAGELAGAFIVLSSLFVSPDAARAAALATLGLTLLCAATVDWKTKRLPNVLTAVTAAIAAGLALRSGAETLLSNALVAVAAVMVLLALRAVAAMKNGEPGLGLGDVKLAGGLGLWLGTALPLAIGAAALLGLVMMRVVRPPDGRLPFGPAMIVGAWGVSLIQEAGLWPATM